VTWCGDGVRDAAEGESCDDGAQNGQPGKCNVSCNGTVPNTPPPPVCGNGVVESGESCDDGAQNGQPGKCNATCNGVVPTPVPGVCSSIVLGNV
jgi:cysteine-rich repeat protein